MEPSGIDDDVRRVLQLGRRITMNDAWSLLTREQRAAAITKEVMNAREAGKPAAGNLKHLLALQLIEATRGFRPSTILAWSSDKLIEEVSRLRRLGNAQLLAALLLEHHLPILVDVQVPWFDRLGVSHNNGLTTLEDLPEFTSQELENALTEVWPGHASRAMAIYLISLATVYPNSWGELAPLLSALVESEPRDRATHERVTESPPDVEHYASLPEVLDAAPRPRPARVDSARAWLTPLDDELITRIVASAQNVHGAPDEGLLDEIIGELLRLNSTRHSSFFHLGFHDAMCARAFRIELPAANEHRWRWYSAGFVAGLARDSQTDKLVTLFDSIDHVRQLGEQGTGPARYSATSMAVALVEKGRYADVLAFVSPHAITGIPELRNVMLDCGTRLLREQQFAEATPFFESLWTAITMASGVPDSIRSATSRRFAHCLRTQGHLEAARSLLEQLVDVDVPSERAMVLADLAMINAGFGRLAELKLPRTAEESEDFATSLARSIPMLTEAASIGVNTSSHAHYVLGYHALVAGDFARAEGLLESAIGVFDQERERYEPGGLLARARFHLAIARCANIDSNAVRLPAAVDDLRKGLKLGEKLPKVMLEHVIMGLELRLSPEAGDLVDVLLDKTDETLDMLTTSETASRSRALADALFTRFRRENRTESQRIADGHQALCLFCSQGRHAQAGEVLDNLEELAKGGVGVESLLELFAQKGHVTSVWDGDDIFRCRITLLEGLGRFDEAAVMVVGEFNRLVARGGAGARPEAEEMLETLASYPARNVDEIEGLRRRLEYKLEPERLPAAPPSRPVTVLVVGGNETQAQYDEAIRAHYRECALWLTVDFLRTGWSSNWGELIDEFQRRHAQADAVVFLYLMRTEFGRAARRRCTKPWRGCGGRGRASLQRAIDAAAAAALSRPA